MSQVDDSSALLLEAVARCDELTLDLADSGASVDMMKKEKMKIKTESCRLRNESQAIHVLSLPFSESSSWIPCRNKNESKLSSSSYFSSIGGHDNDKLNTINIDNNDDNDNNDNNNNYNNNNNINNYNNNNNDNDNHNSTQMTLFSENGRGEENYPRGLAIEERVLLMQHMENLYHQAVQTRSVSKREQQNIKSKISLITIECEKSKEEISELDEKILIMKNRKTESEEALRNYTNTNNLKEIQTKMMATVDYHDNILQDMEQDKKHLLILMTAALQNEEKLKIELTVTREKILEYHRKKVQVRCLLV